MNWSLLLYSIYIVIIAYALCSDHNPSTCKPGMFASRHERSVCAYDYFCSQSVGYLVIIIIIINVIGLLYKHGK